MNELIKITESNGKQVVSARELYEQLGFSMRHYAKWYEKNIISNAFAVENEDYTKLPLDGRSKDFAISLDFAKKISMMARTEKGEAVREYFLACERTVELKSKPIDSYQIEDPIARANAWIKEQEKMLALQERNVKLEPRSKYFEQMILTDGLLSMEQTSKLLNIPNIGRNNLYKALRNGNIIQKNNTSPLQHYVNKGYFELKEEIIITNNIRKAIVTTFVTQKGLAFLFKFFGLTTINNGIN